MEPRAFIEYLTPCSVENAGRGWGLRAANLIGHNDVKCSNGLSEALLNGRDFESAKKAICVLYCSRI